MPRPTTLCYNTVIACLDRGHGNGAAEAAQGILERMMVLYADGNIRSRPNTVTYAVTMSVWARSDRGDAADWVVAVLDNIEDLWKAGKGDVSPFQTTYNATLNALFNSGTEKSARRPDSLLRKMEELFWSSVDGYIDMRPDVISYTSFMNTWVGCGIIRLIRLICQRSSGREGETPLTMREKKRRRGS